MPIDKFGRKFQEVNNDIEKKVEKTVNQKLQELVGQPIYSSRFIFQLNGLIVKPTLQYLLFQFLDTYKFPLDNCAIIDIIAYGQAATDNFIISINNKDYENLLELRGLILNQDYEIKCRIPFKGGLIASNTFLIDFVLETKSK